MKKILTLLLVLSGLGVSAQQVVQVADINVGAGSSYPSYLTEFNNEMYFTANSGTGYEIWKYDGVNPPVMIVDSNTNSMLHPIGFKSFNGKMYFTYSDINTSVGDGIWMYDGANQLTLVAELNPTGADFNLYSIIFFTEFNNKLYFTGTDGTVGDELWEYDGVNAPSLVADLNTNPAPNNSSAPRGLIVFQNKLYFVATDGITNNLMAYDGINPPTVILANIANSSYPSVIMNNKLHIVVQTNVSSSFSTTVFEYDGVNTPTQVTSNLGAGQTARAGDVYASFFGKLYLGVIPNATGIWETWQYDGISSLASPTDDSLSGIGRTSIMYNNELYYRQYDSNYYTDLWKYDGVTAPTRLTNINPGGNSSVDGNLFSFKDKIYFYANDGTSGIELWSYDPLYLTVSKVENATNFSLYPNPTTSNITLQFDQAYTKANIELINTLGQIISNTQSNEMVTTIALPQEKGIYFVRITIDGKSSTQKIVKQ